MRIALTRPVSPHIGRALLTHVERTPIDPLLAQEQHAAYELCLERMGCHVRRLPATPELPDAVFVEDAAVVLDELAIITHPGAEARRAETLTVASGLAPYRPLAHIEAPGFLDGGDVLRVGRQLWIGLSTRTNGAAAEQVRGFLAPFGYEVEGVEVHGCLHLKSAVTQVAKNTLLINNHWVDETHFDGLELIDVAPEEPYAANALMVGERLLYSAGYPLTAERLRARGLTMEIVDMSELAKAEGAVTCCSLVFEAAQ